MLYGKGLLRQAQKLVQKGNKEFHPDLVFALHRIFALAKNRETLAAYTRFLKEMWKNAKGIPEKAAGELGIKNKKR